MLQLIHLEHVIIDFSVTIQHHANFFPAQKLILTVFWDFGHLIFVRPKMSTSVTVFMQISTKKNNQTSFLPRPVTVYNKVWKVFRPSTDKKLWHQRYAITWNNYTIITSLLCIINDIVYCQSQASPPIDQSYN